MTVQEKALALINRCEIGLLGNKDEEGNPQIKAMIKTGNEGLNVFWFCSNTSSRRAKQLEKDGNTCLYFFEGFEGVMLRGVSKLSYDEEMRKAFWQDSMRIYYPLGPLDPDFVLIQFTAESGNYYKNLHNEDFVVTPFEAWENVLLTSAGFEDSEERQKPRIAARFLNMLGKPARDAKVLFIPAAAIDDEAKRMADWCFDELTRLGIPPENITVYNLDGGMTADEAMRYDAVYFTGGDTGHLLRRVKETGFDAVVKQMVYSNKVYVGVSAGSIIAAPNIGEPYSGETAGLCLLNAYISVHHPDGAAARTDLPLPHIPLTDNQALAVSWRGYELIEG
ncbi:MAG: Type 1 glutamine amidotransferase-like domain-containing protein [Oscillospiraceae bacterium]|nr:Type 1 glutamine amidotransferase-like domain-containing protein [Oscillospiraceae bacterium]